MMASIFELTRQSVFYNREFLKPIDSSSKMLLDQNVVLRRAINEGDTPRAREAAGEDIDLFERSLRLGLEQQRREVLADKRQISASSMERFSTDHFRPLWPCAVPRLGSGRIFLRFWRVFAAHPVVLAGAGQSHRSCRESNAHNCASDDRARCQLVRNGQFLEHKHTGKDHVHLLFASLCG
ncbi:MAG: hypothetical protein AAFZ10_11550 [Pseudomonadota bacterium]